MMKGKLFLSILFSLSVFSIHASDLSEYEKHYKELNKLRGQLEKLELQKKISDIKREISEAKGAERAARLQASSSPESPSSAASVRGFNPIGHTLKYIIGTGKNSKAVMQSGMGDTKTFLQGQSYNGWRLSIKGRKAIFTKGKETIEL